MVQMTTMRKPLTVALVGLFAFLGLLATAKAAPPTAETSLAFVGESAHVIAGNVAVPVECEGEGAGICSGTVTLSFGARHSSANFSVDAGATETVFVSVPARAATRRGTKVIAQASTARSLGGPSSTRTVLSLR